MSTPPAPPPGGTVYGPFAPTSPVRPASTPPRPGSLRPDDPSYTGPPAPPKPLDVEKLLADAPRPRGPLSVGVSPATLNDPCRGRDRFAAGLPTEITTLGEAFAKAARNLEGLIPFDKVKDLLARRATIAGGTVGASVTAYEGILADGMKVLSSIGYVPPDNLDAGPGDVNFTAADGAAAARENTAALATSAGPGLTKRLDEANSGIAQLTAFQQHGGVLNPGQAAYVRSYYDELARSGTLAHLEGTVSAATPMVGAAAVNHTLSTIGDGLMTFSRTCRPTLPAYISAVTWV